MNVRRLFRANTVSRLFQFIGCVLGTASVMAESPATISKGNGNAWKLHNEVVSLDVAFKDGRLALAYLTNLQAKVDYLAGQPTVLECNIQGDNLIVKFPGIAVAF